MKTRILVAVIGIPVLLAVIFFAPLWAFGIVVGAISALSVWEFLRCTEKDLPLRIKIVSMVFAAAVPIASAFSSRNAVMAAALFLLILYVSSFSPSVKRNPSHSRASAPWPSVPACFPLC